MRSNYTLLILLLLLSGCNNDDVHIELVKVYTNYPKENITWFNAPAQMEVILRIKNKGNKHVAIPNLGILNSNSLSCIKKEINLKKTIADDFILLSPYDEEMFSLESNFSDIKQTMKECDIDYEGIFFQKLLIAFEVRIPKVSENSINALGTDYKVIGNLKAAKSSEFEYIIPDYPIVE